MPGEIGNETWEKDSWSYTGNAGVWTQMSVDEDLNLAYLPVELPTGDYYGGHRPGAGLFGEIAGRGRSPDRQAQMALPARAPRHLGHGHPERADPRGYHGERPGDQGRRFSRRSRDGSTCSIAPTASRSGRSRSVRSRKGDVPGEWYSPTQPFPTKPPAYDRQGVSLDDLIDFTPELKAEGAKVASLYKLGPIFTPPVVSKFEGPRATLMLPSAQGGANWQGGAFDPETKMAYVYSKTTITPLGLVPSDGKRSDMNYITGQAPNPNAPPPAAGAAAGGGGGGEGGGTVTVQGLPLVKPPYGRITAFDMNKGDLVWQIAHGETPDNIRNHAALKGVTIPRTGRAGQIGVLATKTLLIAGEAGFFTTPNGQRGAMLRAYDKATGNEVGAVYMPAPQTGSPMTYFLNGKQYIVVAIAGASYSGELLAFRLPS